MLLNVTRIFTAVTKKKDRIIHPSLSDKEPGSLDYDHEAFVGADAAEEFKKLDPSESRRRLLIIAQKIDKDHNGNITQVELESWIIFTQQRYIRQDSDKQFKERDSDNDNKVQWKEHMQALYGFLNEQDAIYQKPDNFNYTSMIEKDRLRWKAADLDNNQELTEEEFRAFLHPENFEHMRDIVAHETLADIDSDKDGYLSVDEYIGDMYEKDSAEEEPEWIPTEQEHFSSIRDTNKDGKLDVKEVRQWIFPEDYNHAIAEAQHLINASDDNHDGSLTPEEIVAHYDTFVGSQATDWGEALNRHDEF